MKDTIERGPTMSKLKNLSFQNEVNYSRLFCSVSNKYMCIENVCFLTLGFGVADTVYRE